MTSRVIHVVIGPIQVSSLVKYLFKSLLILMALFIVLLSCMHSLNTLIRVLYQIYVLWIFASQYVPWLFNSLMVSLEEQKILFLVKSSWVYSSVVVVFCVLPKQSLPFPGFLPEQCRQQNYYVSHIYNFKFYVAALKK